MKNQFEGCPLSKALLIRFTKTAQPSLLIKILWESYWINLGIRRSHSKYRRVTMPRDAALFAFTISLKAGGQMEVIENSEPVIHVWSSAAPCRTDFPVMDTVVHDVSLVFTTNILCRVFPHSVEPPEGSTPGICLD